MRNNSGNIPGIYNIGPLYRNDTWLGLGIQYKDIYGTPIPITDMIITMQIRINCAGGAVVAELTFGGGLTMVDASIGKFKIDEMFIPYAAGNYTYDIENKYLNG